MGDLVKFRRRRSPPPRVKCRFCRFTLARTKKAAEKMLFHVKTEHEEESKKAGGRPLPQIISPLDPDIWILVAENQARDDKEAFRSKEKQGVRIIKGDKQ